MNFPFHRFHVALLILFAAKAVLLGATLANGPDVLLYGDGTEFAVRAEALWRTGEFGLIGGHGTVRDDAYRLPGYPVFLALTRVSEGPAHVAVWSALQLILFHAWLLIVGNWIVRRHGGRSAVYFVVALSLTLPWVHYVTAVQSDFQFALLTFSGVLLLLSASEAPDRGRAPLIGAALCLGGAALTRPDLIFFPFWMAGFWAVLAIRNARRPGDAAALRAAPSLVVALAVFGFMAAWTARNFMVTGRLVYASVIDTAIGFFAGRAEVAPQDVGSGLGVAEILRLAVVNAGKIGSEMGAALAQLFLNPSRWYLHFYTDHLGVDLPSSGVPFAEIGFWSLPALEKGYVAVGILVPATILAVFAVFLYLLARGRAAIPWPSAALVLWAAAYLVLQKGVWGALTPGSGQRYAMSILPFLVYCGALAFARPPVRAEAGAPRAGRGSPRAGP